MGNYRSIALVALAILILAPQFLHSTNFSLKEASAQTNTLLRTSVANVPDKKFYGAQIIQIVIDDSEIRDLGKGRPTVSIDGKDIVTVQGNDGRWYAYIADSSSLLSLDANGVNIGIAPTETGGTGSGIVGYIHSAVIPRNEVTAATSGIASPAGAPSKSTQWPFIQLFTFTTDQESTIQYIKAGSVVASDKIKFSRPAITLALEASQYPRDADVVAQVTDYMMNIDPTAKDSFYYRYSSPTAAIFYEDASGARRDITSIFGSSLKFSSTQMLTSPDLGTVILAKNQDSGADLVKVTESDINSAQFENVDPNTKRADITTSNSAALFSSFTFNYYDKSAVSIVRSFSTKITLPKSDFSPNEKVTVDILDKDLSPSLRIFQDLNPRDGGALAVKVGNPVTLSAVSATPDSITPLNQSLADGSIAINDFDGSSITTTSIFIKRPTDILYFSTAAPAKSITITYPAGTAAKLNGFTHVNIDLNGLSLSSFNSATITIGSNTLDTITSKSMLVAIPSGVSFSDPVTLTIAISGGTDDPIVASQNRLIVDFMNLSSSNDDGFYRSTIKTDNVYGDYRSLVQFKMSNPAAISPNVQDLKFIDDPIIWLSSGHTGLDALRVLYGDLDDSGTERSVVNVMNIITSTGTIMLDRTSYKAGDNMKITLTDKDLDSNPDTIQTYSSSVDLIQIEWLPAGSTTTVLSPPDTRISYTFVETAKNSGIFEAVFKLPDNLSSSGKLKVKYKDLLDSEGVTREITKELTLSITTAKVSLDRDTYPSGARVYIEIADDDLNTNPNGVNVVSGSGLLSIRAKTGLTETAIDTDIVETSASSGIFRTSVNLPSSAKDSFEIIYKDQTTSGTRDIVASAIITNTTASLQTDKPAYSLNEKITVYLTEPDANLDSEKQESIPLSSISLIGGASATLADSRLLVNDTSLRETGTNTGVFAVTFQLPSDESVVKNKGTFDLSYRDSSTTTGLETVSTTVAMSPLDIDVSLDRSTYSWTNRVYITVKDSSKNFDPSNVDRLNVDVKSSQQVISNYVLEEDGINSDTFKGYVTLTGDGTKGSSGARNIGIGPTDGKLPAKDGDAISVQYKVSNGDFRTASANIKWNIATLSFDKPKYDKNSLVKVTVEDPDANLNPDGVDTVTARISSLEDSFGIEVKLTETGKETGIFSKILKMGDSISSNTIAVSATEEDVISARYNDDTIPGKTIQAKEILAASIIGAGTIETLPAGDRAQVRNVAIENPAGVSLDSSSTGSQLVISSTVKNNYAKQDLEYTYIVQITNELGETVYISIQSAKLGPTEATPIATTWTIEDHSIYKVDLFVISNLNNPEILSNKQTMNLFFLKNALNNKINLDEVPESDRSITALFKIYSERPDLQSTFPEVASANDLSKLYEWAITTGVTTDNAAHILRPYVTVYSDILLNSTTTSPDSKELAELLKGNKDAIFALLDIYTSRQDLQQSFPEVKDSNSYGKLFKWAVTDGLKDVTAKTTIEPFTSVYTSHLLDLAKKGSIGMDLLANSNTWTTVNDASISRTDNGLTLTSNTNKSEQLFNRAILKTKINFDKPIMYFDYSTQTVSGTATFLLEIRDSTESKVLFTLPLSDTTGKIDQRTLNIPSQLANQDVVFRVYIVTTGAGNHTLTIEKAIIV